MLCIAGLLCESQLLLANFRHTISSYNKRRSFLLTTVKPLGDVTSKVSPEVGMGLFTFRKKVSTTGLGAKKMRRNSAAAQLQL